MLYPHKCVIITSAEIFAANIIDFLETFIMYRIFKITSNPVVDFAAEELKKYLRMMMPRAGEIVIERKADATGGFRLGLMADFDIDTSEADDVELDDIIHIDTDAEGGIIAGSNPRSVLLAVYKYLTAAAGSFPELTASLSR